MYIYMPHLYPQKPCVLTGKGMPGKTRWDLAPACRRRDTKPGARETESLAALLWWEEYWDRQSRSMSREFSSSKVHTCAHVCACVHVGIRVGSCRRMTPARIQAVGWSSHQDGVLSWGGSTCITILGPKSQVPAPGSWFPKPHISSK